MTGGIVFTAIRAWLCANENCRARTLEYRKMRPTICPSCGGTYWQPDPQQVWIGRRDRGVK